MFRNIAMNILLALLLLVVGKQVLAIEVAAAPVNACQAKALMVAQTALVRENLADSIIHEIFQTKNTVIFLTSSPYLGEPRNPGGRIDIYVGYDAIEDSSDCQINKYLAFDSSETNS